MSIKDKRIKWSSKEIDFLKKVCAKGIFVSQIVRDINNKFWSGKKIRTIRSINNICYSRRISINREKPKDKWSSKASVDQIKALISQGYNKKQIAEHFIAKGAPTETIKNILIALPKSMFHVSGVLRRKYTASQMEDILMLHESGVTISEIATALNATPDGIKNTVSRWKVLRRNLIEDLTKGIDAVDIGKKYNLTQKEFDMFRKTASTASSIYNSSEKWTAKDGDKILDILEKAKDVFQSTDSRQEDSLVRIKTNSDYIAIVFGGDLHIESAATDLKQLRKDFELISKTDNVYFSFGGDICDNYIPGGKHGDGANERLIPIKMARIAAGRLFEILGPKVLWLALGCHDNWSIAIDDYNLVEHMSRKLDAVYLGHGGTVNLQFLDQRGDLQKRYRTRIMHRFGGGSLHPLSACKNYLMRQDPSIDICAIGHNHVNAIGTEDYGGRKRVYLRTGSYKSIDRYAASLNIKKQKDHKAPILILGTREHFMQPVSDIQRGVKILKALNSK